MVTKEDDELNKAGSSITKIVLLTSLVWFLVGAGLYFTLIANNNKFLSCESCYRVLNTLELELVKQQEIYNDLIKRLPVEQTEREIPVSIRINQNQEYVPKKIEEYLVKGPELETTRKQGDNSEWFKEDFSNSPTNPPEWHGENGRAVVMPEQLKEESKERFSENQFDIVASDLIALNRTIPDQRSDS